MLNIQIFDILKFFSDVYSFLLQFGAGRNFAADARSNFFLGLCNTVNFIDHPRRAFYTRSHNVSVHSPRDFSARQNSETTGMRSTFADKQFWLRFSRGSAYLHTCVRATLYTRNVNRPAACTQVTPLPRAWRERAVVPRREAARVWLTEFMGSTYRALTALYINNDTRTRGRSFPPHAIPTGPFYAFLRCTFRLSLFTADKSPVNTTYFENCDAANTRCDTHADIREHLL